MRIRRGEEVGEKGRRKRARKGLRNEVQKGERTWLRSKDADLVEEVWIRRPKKGRSFEEGNKEKDKGKVKIEE
jgi:hypothetical protein